LELNWLFLYQPTTHMLFQVTSKHLVYSYG
jgi:hypothetical protein